MAQVISTYTISTNAGDTFDELALNLLGSEFLSSEIMALNQKYTDVLIFGEGIDLTIPVFEDKETPDTLPPWRE